MAFKFNGQSLPSKVKVNSIRSAILPTITQNTVKVKGRDGVVDYGNEIDARVIEVDVTIIATGESDLRSEIRDFAEWLYTKDPAPLVLDSEPGVTYYAKISGDSNIDEILHVGQGTISFFCADPYAYGALRTMALIPTSLNIPTPISNNGGVESFPEFTFQFTQNVTAFKVKVGSEELLFGKPTQVDASPVDPNPLRVQYTFSDTTGWSSVGANSVDEGVVTGTIAAGGISNGYSLRWNESGYNASYPAWYGISGKRSIGYQLQDFRMETVFGLRAGEVGELGRVEVYFLDVNGVQIGKQALRLGNPDAITPFAQARVGYNNYVVNSEAGKGTYGLFPGVWREWAEGKMAVARRGKEWSFYWAMHDANGADVARWTEFWTDENNLYDDKVAQIQIHIGSHVYGGDNPVETMYITDIKIWELNVAPVTQYVDPYVFKIGDVLKIDCATGEVRKNGTPYYEYLDPASKFMSLKKGSNNVSVSPLHITNGLIKHKERWL